MCIEAYMIIICFCFDENSYFGMIKEIIMSLGEEIVLRPRFKSTIPQASKRVLDRLEATKGT
jgi:hypothetical protein